MLFSSILKRLTKQNENLGTPVNKFLNCTQLGPLLILKEKQNPTFQFHTIAFSAFPAHKKKDANHMTGSTPASVNHKTILNLCSEKFSAAQRKTTGLITGVLILRNKALDLTLSSSIQNVVPSITAGCQLVKSKNILGWVHPKQNTEFRFERDSKITNLATLYQCHCED